MNAAYLRSLHRVARSVYPKKTWDSRGQRLLFLLRHLVQYANSRRWIEYLSRPGMAAVADQNPSLYRKSIRPYVSKNWPGFVKVDAMIHHYEFLRNRTTPDVFARLCSAAGADVAILPVKGGDRLTVRLRYDSKFRKEGETTLELLSEKHRCRVFCLTFVLAADARGQPCLIIGAVSGLTPGADKNVIKDTTKAMFGLRPKALLLVVLQRLARFWNVQAIFGVGSLTHTSRHPAYALNRSRHFEITYDEFWREVGGALRSDGLFSLPLVFVERHPLTIESHKRSLYRHRYAWIRELHAMLRTRLVEWQPTTRPIPVVSPVSSFHSTVSSSPALASTLLFFAAVLAGHRGYCAETEAWSIHGQTTVVEQWHGAFSSAYSGLNSLQASPEDKHTATATLFLGRRLWAGAELYFDPELTQGNGLSGAVGVAGFPNGEATRAGNKTPEYNTARLFLRQTFGLGGAREAIGADDHQLAGFQDVERLTFTIGKLSATDLFDDNTYSHDPRGQLLNWALMDNGAWDYPADTKGYTGGCTVDWKLQTRSLRWGVFLEPAEANGRALDPHWSRAHGQAFEWEERYTAGPGPGVLRALAFWNRADMGSYAQALQSTTPPDVTLTRRYRSKTGAGLDWEQQIAGDLGAFARIGFNDGRAETWAFTEIDRTASLGLSLKGRAWRRPDDTLALAAVGNGLSSVHRSYLAAGGYGFIVGDGALNYGPEKILEAVYDWKPVHWLALAGDVQLVSNPGYNRDRGPVAVFATRLHAAF